ncbi:HAD family hydrolase [Marinobacteraceae bacterium S3BR75-40.1]
MPRPSTVLFDLDGTLVDTAPDFVLCLNQQRERHGLPPLPEPQIRRVVSNGGRALVKTGFGLNPDDPEFARYLDELLDLYQTHLASCSGLFPGMDNLLTWLEQQRVPWGVVTNKPSRFTLPLLEKLELASRCAVTVCPDHVEERKPHPESLLLACSRIGVSPTGGIYVGDHERDIEAGRRAGMLTVAVRYGYLEHPEVIDAWDADYTAEDAAALLEWLQRRTEAA